MEANIDRLPPSSSSSFKSTFHHNDVSIELDLYTIPSHSFWFSWDSIHDTERIELREFFDGSSFTRTPKIYKEYRDFIISKYREDPSRRLTFTEVRKSLVGDVHFLNKVFIFLDKWGLINFSASPLSSSSVEQKLDEGVKVRVEEGAPIGVRVVGNPNTLKPLKAPPSVGDADCYGGVDNGFKLPPLASYSVVFGELEAEKGMLCGNCKEKCESTYYECTKEKCVICLKCFEKGLYGENRSVDDFKLNDNIESIVNQGGVWTEAETLLLLESVLKHGDDWDLVAQNVQTKTKFECISRLIELPFGELMLGSHGKLSAKTLDGNAGQEQKASSVSQEKGMLKIDHHQENHHVENNLNKENNDCHVESNNLHKENDDHHVENNNLHKENDDHDLENNKVQKENDDHHVESNLHKENDDHHVENNLHKENDHHHVENNLLKENGDHHVETNLHQKNDDHDHHVENNLHKENDDHHVKNNLHQENDDHNVENNVHKENIHNQEIADRKITQEMGDLEPPSKKSRIDSPDPSRSLMEQVALISTMVVPPVAAAAANAAVSVLCDGNPLLREVFYSDDNMSIDGQKSGNLDMEMERAFQSEDTEMKDTFPPSEIDKILQKEASIPLALRMRAAVATALGAAAAHSKLLADQEEREIEHLMTFIIETQVKKLERKMKFFEELEHMMEKEHAILEESKDEIIGQRVATLRSIFDAGLSRSRDLNS